MEFHQLDLRYEALRTRHGAGARLLASLADDGQQLPVVVVAADAPTCWWTATSVCARSAAGARHRARDGVGVGEAEALLLEQRDAARPTRPVPLEQGWLLAALRRRFGLPLDALARRFDQRELGAPPARAGARAARAGPAARPDGPSSSPHAAMKYLVPLARANARDVPARWRRRSRRIGSSTRQIGRLYQRCVTGPEDHARAAC